MLQPLVIVPIGQRSGNIAADHKTETTAGMLGVDPPHQVIRITAAGGVIQPELAVLHLLQSLGQEQDTLFIGKPAGIAFEVMAVVGHEDDCGNWAVLQDLARDVEVTPMNRVKTASKNGAVACKILEISQICDVACDTLWILDNVRPGGYSWREPRLYCLGQDADERCSKAICGPIRPCCPARSLR